MSGNRVPRLTIAGLEVPGGMYGDHHWPRPLGVNAPEVVWCLPPRIADAVLALQETEITMAVAGQTTPKTFKRVKVVCERATDHPLKRYVLLSDTRWYLPKIYVKENYNLRTESSETQLYKVDGSPLEVDPVNSVVMYAANSMKGGSSPWNADEILADVLARRLGVKFKRVARSLGAYYPNDVQLDGPGNVALAHAMGAVGGLDIRVNDDGDFELIDGFLGAEKDTIEKFITYSLLRRGKMRWVNMANAAPTKVQVGFDAELEVRADGWLQAPGVTVDPKAAGQWPTLDNVMRVTDKQLTTTDAVTGKSYQAVQGSYLPVDQWFSAVAADAVVPAPSVPAQVSWTRSFACFDYFRGLMEFWYVTGKTGGLEATAAWVGRFGTIKSDLLKTWRLNPAFASLCIPGTIRPVRAQLLDAANQQRQPSAWYGDVARRPSTRGVRDEKNFGWNVHNIPGTPTTQKVGATKTYSDTSFPSQVVPIDQCTQAAVSVRLLDPVSGIFRLEYRKDVFDHTAEIVPGLVQELPTNDLDQVNRAAGIAYWQQSQLVTTHRGILVFTAVPAAAPLYTVEVSFADAIKRLGVRTNTNPKGPTFQTRTGPALQTARIAYADSIRASIQSIFAATSPADAAKTLQSLTPVNLGILQDYAQSVAAVLCAAMLDHYEGSQEIAFKPDAMPVGSLQSVTHTVYASGRTYTRFEAKHVIPPVQPIHLMERGARATIFRSPANFA